MRGMPVIRRERFAAFEIAGERKIDGSSAGIEAAPDFQAQQAGDMPELGLSELRLPAEAFVRLLYGRMDKAHTPPAESAGVELDELRPLFPGF